MGQPKVVDDPYRVIADYFDLEHDEFTDDLGLYLDLARQHGDPVLDAGCGTGRVTAALAAAGYRVIGLDASAAMLDRARQRFAHVTAEQVRWLEGRLTDPPAGGPVALAIVALNTWNHLTGHDERRQAAVALAGWVRPGGYLVLDLSPPDLGLIGQPDDLVRLLWQGHDPVTGDAVMKFESRRTDEARQVQRVTVFYDRIDGVGNLRRVQTVFGQRYTFPREAAADLERGGFIVQNVFGSYDFAPYEAGSDRLIVVARRAGEGETG